MTIKYTSLKITSSKQRDFSGFRYDLIISFTRSLYDKPSVEQKKTIISNGTFNQSGSSTIHKFESGIKIKSVKYFIKYGSEKFEPINGDISEVKGSSITKYELKTTHGLTRSNSNHTQVVNVKKEKEKFIILCGGRGMGDHNQGANFLNCAKYHIEEIKKNAYPGVPKFDPSTCEIVSHIDIYNMGKYTVFTEIDGKKESPSGSGIMVLDGYYDKPVPKGEIHRTNEFLKIFTYYKKIKYIAYFGHSWSYPDGNGESYFENGYLHIGDRSLRTTNLGDNSILGISKNNVLSDAQFRFFGCRSAYTGEGKPIAELFARYFKGRQCYGWEASGGSIFTHDKKLGHTGIQPKIDPNTQKVDTNRKMAWLTANGRPEGWKMFKK